MTEIIKWLITSSTDPKKISLFVTSATTLAVLFGLDQTVVNDAGNQIVNFIVGLGMVASSVSAGYGLYRKFKEGQWSAHPGI